MFFYVYIALGQGQTMPWSQNFDPNRKALTICCKFKKILFQLWLYTYFLIILYMYIA